MRAEARYEIFSRVDLVTRLTGAEWLVESATTPPVLLFVGEIVGTQKLAVEEGSSPSRADRGDEDDGEGEAYPRG